MTTIYRLWSRMLYSQYNEFTTAVYKFQGSKSFVKSKFNFLKKLHNDLDDINSLLYKKLPKDDAEFFILWLFRRWIGGGGG